MSQTAGDWTFYILGITLVILGIAFLLVPILSKSGTFTGLKIPWYIIYTYNSRGFYFATSPILIAISALTLIYFLLRR